MLQSVKKAEADKYVVEQNALADKAREIARAQAEAEKSETSCPSRSRENRKTRFGRC